MSRFDRRLPVTFGLVVISALGWHLDRRSPDWLSQDPILQPFGRNSSSAQIDSLAGAVDWPRPDEAASSAAGPVPTAQSPLNLRTARLEQLCLLPGIGPVLAGRIVAMRDSLGRVRNVEDLLEVKGIGPVKLGRLRPLLRWDEES